MRGFKISRPTIVLFLLVIIISMSSLAAHLMTEHSMAPRYEGIYSLFQKNNITSVKTLHLIMTNHSHTSDAIFTFPFFPLLSYGELHGKNVTFVDEYNLPPQLSKGFTNVPMSHIPLAIYKGNAGECNEAVGELKKSGVQMIILLVDYDLTFYPEPARFKNQTVLDICGLEPVQEDEKTVGSSVFIYTVK